MKFLYNQDEKTIEYYTHTGKYIAKHSSRINEIVAVEQKIPKEYFDEVCEYLYEQKISFSKLVEMLKERARILINRKNKMIDTERTYKSYTSVN